jgi:UDP-N-acetylmuramate--alanine ligase
MTPLKFHKGQHIHLVGIGGAGLSAIARVLLEQGYQVSGSDRSANQLTEALARDGAVIYAGHAASQVTGADALIITSAVKADHVEVAAAAAQGIPIYKRQDIMAELMAGRRVIAVAGTKGKTTTTAMIVHILRECGLDPGYIVGGVMGNTGTNAAAGTGPHFVVEADEYDHMFLGLKPDVAVLTNIEWDHPDFFPSPDAMRESFERFVSLLDESSFAGGWLIACTDDVVVRQVAARREAQGRPTTACGLNVEAHYQARNIRTLGEYTLFDIAHRHAKKPHAAVRLPLPGQHNVRNALAACLAASSACDPALKAERVAEALRSFKPAARRFEVRAEMNGIAVIDDYAHNPMSIRAVLEAARQRYPNRAIWAVWQPHTYSRTQALFGDFITAFDQADHVLVTEIYAARESPVIGVSGAAVAAAIRHPSARYTATFVEAVRVLTGEVCAPAAVIIMSAGDASQIGAAYANWLREQGAGRES